MTCVEDIAKYYSYLNTEIDLYLAISGCYEHRHIICNIEEIRTYDCKDRYEMHICGKLNSSSHNQQVNTLTHLDISYNTACDVYLYWTSGSKTEVKFVIHVVNDRG